MPDVTLPPPGSLDGLGRLYVPDRRDAAFRLPRMAASGRTARSWLSPGPALDQGATPTCVGHAGARWLTALPVVNRIVSPFELYAEAQKLDEWEGEDYDGTSVRGLFKAFRARGLIAEFNWATDARQVMNYVLDHGPMVMGTDWFEDMFAPDDAGYIQPTGGLAGGHSYLFMAANSRRKNPDGTVGALRVLNSWGPNWAQKGRAWITLEHVDFLMGRYGEAATAAELRLR